MSVKRAIYIDGFRVDLSVKEEHSFTAETTEHPVEKGLDVTDHIRSLPIEISMDCIVSDTPIGDLAVFRDASNVTLGDTDDIAERVTPSDEAYAHLLKIRADKRLVTIETSRGTFKDMALTALSVPVEASNGGGLYFTATFKQVAIVENRRFTVRTATPSGRGPKNLGKKLPPVLDGSGSSQEYVWRKGVIPGGLPIVATELITATTTSTTSEDKTNPSRKGKQLVRHSTKYTHDDGTELTENEVLAFHADLGRDHKSRDEAKAARDEKNQRAADRFARDALKNPGKPSNRAPVIPSGPLGRKVPGQ